MEDDIKKQITELLNDKKARDAITIMDYLNLGPSKDALVMKILTDMVNNYDLYMTRHNKYMNFKDSDMGKNMYRGLFESKGDYGFVIVEDLDEDIFIPRDFKNKALDGDLVLVNILNYLL